MAITTHFSFTFRDESTERFLFVDGPATAVNGFIAVAEKTGEYLPRIINVHVEVPEDEDDGDFRVIAISGPNGEEIAQDWLEDRAGYVYSLREQIKIRFYKEVAA